MSTRIPWFRYGIRELRRQIRYAYAKGRRWDALDWRDALQRAIRLRHKRDREPEL